MNLDKVQQLVNWVFGTAVIFLAVISVVGFAVDLSDGVLLGDIPPTPKPMPGIAVVVTIAVTPTNTSTPTATLPLPTLAQPTNTPIPPPPTPIPPTLTPTVDLVDLTYRISIQPIMSDYAEAMNYLSITFDEAAETPLVVITDNWKIRAATSFALIRIANESVRELVPSDRFRETHNRILQASELMDQMIVEYSRGIDNLDVEALLNGNRLLTEANEAIQQATLLLPTE